MVTIEVTINMTRHKDTMRVKPLKQVKIVEQNLHLMNILNVVAFRKDE